MRDAKVAGPSDGVSHHLSKPALRLSAEVAGGMPVRDDEGEPLLERYRACPKFHGHNQGVPQSWRQQVGEVLAVIGAVGGESGRGGEVDRRCDGERLLGAARRCVLGRVEHLGVRELERHRGFPPRAAQLVQDRGSGDAVSPCRIFVRVAAVGSRFPTARIAEDLFRQLRTRSTVTGIARLRDQSLDEP